MFPREKDTILPNDNTLFSSFDVPLESRKRNKLADVAGNAMNAHVISILSMWLIVKVNWSEFKFGEDI